MLKKYAILDRDGTLIFEPQDTFQIDSVEKLEILPGVIQGLKRLANNGYKFVMVSNQDGLGTFSFPLKMFNGPQNKMLKIFKKNGIEFEEIFICPHFEGEDCDCRKPKIGLFIEFLKKAEIDVVKSFVCGDRDSDKKLAENLGLRFVRADLNGDFSKIVSEVLGRSAKIVRKTNETDISVEVNLDGTGVYDVKTGIGFFDHMLELFSKHSLIDLRIKATGDLRVDEHHTIEDVGIALGQALAQSLNSKKGIRRYGFLLPMDESLAEVALDLGGRPYLVWNVEFKRERIGDMPTELFEDFFKALSDNLLANIHVNLRYGRNEHHVAEAIFKTFAKALRFAADEDPRACDLIPSTKGKL